MDSATIENIMEASQKITNRTMIQQLLSWVFTWRKKKTLIIHDIYTSSLESLFIIYYGKKSESISLSVLSDSV